MRMWQGASGYSPYSGILSPAYTVITPKEGVSSRFFAYLIKRPKTIHLFEINSQGLTKDTWNLKFPAFAPIEVKAPVSYEEQVNIARILIQLDNIITLHQRKYDKLVAVKKSLLEKMFSADGETVPKIRFKGFSDTWEQRKLGELFSFRYGDGNTNPSNGGQYPVFGAGGIQGGYTEFNAENSIIIGHMGDAGCVSWGDGKHFVTYNGTITKPKNDIFSSKFGYYLLLSMDLRKYRGGSGLPFLTYEMLTEMCTQIPKEKDETRLIAECFSYLDNLITLHQCKVFSKNIIFMNIKFGGLETKNNISWEQRKVSDLAEKTYGGGTPTTSNEAYWNGDIPWIQSSDVVDGKLLGVEPRKWITQDGLNNSAAQLIPGNSIAIITRVGVGKLAFMPYSYTTSQDFLSLSKLNAEPLFTVYACYKKLQTELNAVQGTSIKGITKDELLAKNIMVPRYAEQQQIGAFFKQLDHLITLHQRKCALLFSSFQALIAMMFTTSTFSWEQRKLGDIGETYTGLSGKTKADFGHGQARFVTYMNVFSNPISNPEMTEPIEIDPKQNEVEVGDVFFTTSSETPEEVGMSSVLLEKRGKTYLNSFCFGFRPSEKIDSYYLAYMLRSESARDKIILLAQGISRYNISKNKVMEIAVSLPSLDEQKMIGQYFRQLDNLITLHQRKPNIYTGGYYAE